MPAFSYLGGSEYGRGLLEGALAEPQQTYGGRYVHRTIYDKGAALFRSIIKDHPLVDGNKRLALTSLTVFLLINGYLFVPSQENAVGFALRVAAESNISLVVVARWVRKNSLNFVRRKPSEAERRRLRGLGIERVTRLVRSLNAVSGRLPQRS